MDCSGNDSATLKQDDNGNNDDHVQQQINEDTQQGQVKQPAIATLMVVNKGKRTKRQHIRSSSTNDHHQRDDLVIGNDDDDVEELDLDMAKCLILLAQGQSIPGDQSGQLRGSMKRRRRSYSSSCLSLGLTAGVYACQTCNRTFSSFQALGGHRASHKKLNITTTTSSTSHHDYFINPLALQLGNINYIRAEASPNPIVSKTIPTASTIINDKKSVNKIHECTICATEFSSGQALGGHMRRHRGPVIPINSSTTVKSTNTIAASTTLSLSTTAINNVDSTAAAAAAGGGGGKVADRISNNNDSFLSLDLNLPASPSSEFSLHPKQQSAAMVFSSTPALVDCFH